MTISALCLDWHIKQSDAFIDMLTGPLSGYADVKLQAWDGESYPKKLLKDPVVIFCMLPPTEEFLKAYKGRAVWLPMWDQAQSYDQDWWDGLPKNLHVVAFSEQIVKKASAANLPLLKLRYFKDPDDFKPVSWDRGLVVFYWNRAGLIGPEFLKELCLSVEPRKLIFLSDIDPRIDKEKSYSLPGRIGKTSVVNLKHSSRKSYLEAVNEANIFIAPRASEGVGMTFLEAMAKGCCVIAYDAPTMNEYIKDGGNGLLLRNEPLRLIHRITGKKPVDAPSGEKYYLKTPQDWSRIKKTDFQALGTQARANHITGYRTWQEQIPGYAEFVLDKP